MFRNVDPFRVMARGYGAKHIHSRIAMISRQPRRGIISIADAEKRIEAPEGRNIIAMNSGDALTSEIAFLPPHSIPTIAR